MQGIIQLLAALIIVESGGDRYAIGDGGKGVGCLQIHKICVDDVNRILGEKVYTYEDRYSVTKSKAMAIIYMRHYSDGTVEDMARVWNGGPRRLGGNKYWKKVKAVLDSSPAEGEK